MLIPGVLSLRAISQSLGPKSEIAYKLTKIKTLKAPPLKGRGMQSLLLLFKPGLFVYDKEKKGDKGF